MKIALPTLETALKCIPLVKGIDIVPGGFRMETAMLYPDGSSIDIFLEQREQSTMFDFRLTDFGQTISWLSEIQLRPWQSKKRQRMLAESLRVLNISQEGGELFTHVDRQEDLSLALVRLAQACSRVSDMAFTRRASLPSVFMEDVEELFSDLDLNYESPKEITGKFGKPVKVDFLVIAPKKTSAVLTMSSGNPGIAHSQSLQLFYKFYDLAGAESVDSRLTIYDDSKTVYRDEDLKRLEEVSRVLPLSDRDSILESLTDIAA